MRLTHQTRNLAIHHALERLTHHVQSNYRVLIGFDFPYGYPHGFAKALGFDDEEPWINIWQDLSDRIKDDEHNKNNRFGVASELNKIISGEGVGPFWAVRMVTIMLI